MAVTPFLKLQKPPFDTIPWDEAVNGNMDIIDAFVQRYMAVPNYMGAWLNSTMYVSGQNVLDIVNATIYLCQVTHTSSATPATFAQDRATYPTYWAATTNVVSGSTALTISEATPLSSKSGDLWWNSAEGQLYILYNDGNSLQWVVANNQSGNIGDAPRDGNVYGRQMGAWVGSVNSQDVGRNKLHNGLFTVAQRGVGPFTTNALYTVDRWVPFFSLDTVSIAPITAADAARTQVGDETMQTVLQNTFTGNAGAGAYNIVTQGIENVRRLAGRTVILSFWAATNSGAPKLGVSIDQAFGTGGSPSARVNGNGQSVATTTTFTRYSLTFTVPSVTGMTLGSNNDSATWLNLWYSCGSTNAVRAGNIGVQSGLIWLWGVQLEIAAPGQTQPSPLEKLDPRMELANCQRFYLAPGQVVAISGYSAAAANNIAFPVLFPVQMRGVPTIAFQANTFSGNVNSMTAGGVTAAGFNPTVGTSAAGYSYWVGAFTASADL